jgi:hypothetical protein
MVEVVRQRTVWKNGAFLSSDSSRGSFNRDESYRENEAVLPHTWFLRVNNLLLVSRLARLA